MQFLFDWDDTLSPFRHKVAAVLSEVKGYEIPVEAIPTKHWNRLFNVDGRTITAGIDQKYGRGVELAPHMAGLLGELLFLGHGVTVTTARSDIAPIYQALQACAPDVKVQWAVPFKGRAQSIEESLGFIPDYYFDDDPSAVFAARARGWPSAHIMQGPGNVPHAFRSAFAPEGLAGAADIRILLSEKLRMLPSVVGISGLARAGKDTAADQLLERSLGYVRLTFAQALKALAHDLLDKDTRTLWGGHFVLPQTHVRQVPAHKVLDTLDELCVGLTAEDIDQKTEAGRKLLQYLGTEVARELIKDTFWVDNLEERVASVFGFHYRIAPAAWRIVVSDVRYRNEAEWVRRNKGQLLHLCRRGAGLTGTNAQHTSEGFNPATLWSDVTQYENNGSTAELGQAVEQLLLRGCRS